MLYLMTEYQKQYRRSSFLRWNYSFVETNFCTGAQFSDNVNPIKSMMDSWIQEVVSVLHFFQDWEKDHVSESVNSKHLITRETREDIDFCLYGLSLYRNGNSNSPWLFQL